MNKLKQFFESFRVLRIRYKLGLVFFLPVLLTLIALVTVHYVVEKRSIDEDGRIVASQFGQIALTGLKHAMLRNDPAMVQDVLDDTVERQVIQRAQVVDMNGVIRRSSHPTNVGTHYQAMQQVCAECHRLPLEKRPQTVDFEISPTVLQVAIPIENEAECLACHESADRHLGLLVVDVSTADAQKQLSWNTLGEFLLSLATILVGVLLSLLLVEWLIVRRVDVIHSALVKLGDGDLSTRITQRWRTEDEITRLAEKFNQTAAYFESLQARQVERERVRVQAITEERERLARELHDGIAQFLGYLSAKVAAVRVSIRNQQIQSADANLEQIEASIRSQSVDVRSAIVGLKISGAADQNLAGSVVELVEQCNLLGGLHLEMEMIGDVQSFPLSHEASLQLFRILQEAVSNVRKHSQASSARIRFERQGKKLIMSIEDQGVGFDPLLTGLGQKGHFGLKIMLERAQDVGAQIEIKSAPGQGTRVIVTIISTEDENARFGSR